MNAVALRRSLIVPMTWTYLRPRLAPIPGKPKPARTEVCECGDEAAAPLWELGVAANLPWRRWIE